MEAQAKLLTSISPAGRHRQLLRIVTRPSAAAVVTLSRAFDTYPAGSPSICCRLQSSCLKAPFSSDQHYPGTSESRPGYFVRALPPCRTPEQGGAGEAALLASCLLKHSSAPGQTRRCLPRSPVLAITTQQTGALAPMAIQDAVEVASSFIASHLLLIGNSKEDHDNAARIAMQLYQVGIGWGQLCTCPLASAPH